MQVFLNIIYFFIALSVLVCIHEAGHLSMAKLFDVYCDEYSIGFGPKLYQHKPSGVNKKGKPRETKFTIRAIPVGGYVSMAGEGMEDVEELCKLPKERFLTGIAKWKRAIIMVAGVFLNALLGIILLIVAYSTIPVPDYRSTSFEVANKVTYVNESGEKSEIISPAFEKGLTSTSNLTKVVVTYHGDVENKVTESDKYNTATYEYTINPGTMKDQGGAFVVLNHDFNTYLPQSSSDTKTFTFYLENGEVKEVSTTAYVYRVYDDKDTNQKVTEYRWNPIGITYHGRARTFGEVMSHSFSTFGEYSIAIYKALGQIFTKDGFDQLGGPIAIVQQQMTFASNGLGYFLLFWGLISINLAVINLLPFPGLDGWHLLVVIVESITRKEINPKVKSIMSAIGMVLLFGLMIAITCKDIIKLFI